MKLFMTYIFFCALPLLLAWLGLVMSLLIVVRLSNRRTRPVPIERQDQGFQRQNASAAGQGQPV
jgi:hypothetical protein